MGSLPVLRQAEIETDWIWQAVAVCERAAAVILLQHIDAAILRTKPITVRHEVRYGTQAPEA